ncbi:MAG: hypothetical protein K2J04_01355, partial [Lachnospiraceae bacterium]|nr:hypothetical protein [Lachnospiraceae bacterium]
MNKKIRLSYIILAATLILFLSVHFYKKTGSTDIPTASYTSDSQKTPVTEYISASELTDEDTLLQGEVPTNPYSDLSVPTYITKVDDTYFIVDCYHNQVIYHENLSAPLNEWHVVTDEINMGHTLASDGIVYLVDDTENNRILIFEKKDGRFLHTQTFSEIGNRPHY